MRGANRLPDRLARPAVFAFALTTLGVIGLVDYLTGYEVSFGVFYLVPAGLAAWYASGRFGALFAVAASVVWYMAERGAGYPYSHPAIPVWNAIVRLGFFVTVALLLAALRERLLTERRLAKTDPLTGALNMRAFTEQLERDLALAGRTKSPMTLAYIDIDDFKRVNDTYGHAAGDDVLRGVASALTAGTRRTDSVARLGGDEFALILPGTDLDGARKLLTDLGASLKRLAESAGRGATLSIGAVVFEEPPARADAAVGAADRLMYRAKTRGKDAVVLGAWRGTAVEIVADAQPRQAAWRAALAGTSQVQQRQRDRQHAPQQDLQRNPDAEEV